jgi:hypothetical protein
MNTVLELSSTKALHYFMEPANYCTLELPVYINFAPVLLYVEKTVGDAAEEEIQNEKEPKPFDLDDINHKLLIKKDAKYTFRPIQITNPYLYYLLVRLMTGKTAWKQIRNRFQQFQRPQIEVSSIPRVKSEKDKSHKSAGVFSWWENMEQRSLALSLQYKYLFVTDITNCYASIYTHTIAWALMGKEEACKGRFNKKLLANQIDRYIRWMQSGQSNGIPLGSAVFDFIAELVLGYADMLVADRLEDEGITDYKILRYRDDYKVFCNSKEHIDRIAFVLQEVLAGLNFQLNAKKTEMTEEVVRVAVKPDKIAYTTGSPLYRKSGGRVTTLASTLQQEALYIHQFGKEFPNSGTLIKLLTIFSQRMRRSKRPMDDQDVEVLIAIFTEVALGSPKVYKLVLHLISHLVNKLPTTEQREKVVRSVYQKFNMIPNIGELQIWMQHITYQMPEGINYTEPLCKIVAGDKDINLWNNNWVKKSYRKDFPQDKICTEWLRDSFTPIIDIDEVSLFEMY